MAKYELKYEDDIIDVIDMYDRICDIRTDVEHMEFKYIAMDDPVSIYLRMISRGLSSALLSILDIVDVLPKEARE